MTQSNSLPSALKVAAEVDAALAQAGLAGPQVEREAIPMYLAMLHELIDCPETHSHLPDLKKSNAAELVAVWMRAEQLTPDQPSSQNCGISTAAFYFDGDRIYSVFIGSVFITSGL